MFVPDRRILMETKSGAAVVIVGGGVSGLSAGWWLARSGVDVLVLEKNIVGWEASGRNGGGATHVYSPFGLEEQRLWPQMDELLGYPTEYQPYRIGVALSETQWALARRWAEIGEARGFRWDLLDRRQLKELVPIVGDNAIGGTYLHFGGHANPHSASFCAPPESCEKKKHQSQAAKPKLYGEDVRGKSLDAVSNQLRMPMHRPSQRCRKTASYAETCGCDPVTY